MGRIMVAVAGIVVCLGLMQDARAQGITIDTGDVKILFAPGASLPQRIDTLTRSADIGAPGATSWDFTKIRTTSVTHLIGKVPSSTTYAADFPAATHALQDTAFTYGFYSATFGDILLKGNGFLYYTLAGGKLNNAGFKGAGSAYIFGNPYPANGAWLNTPPATELVFPLQMGSTWNSEYTESISGSVFALGRDVPFGPVYNTHAISYVVDAYGSLTLPDGLSREALRIRKTDHYVNGSAPGTRVGYIIRARDGSSVQFSVDDTTAVRGTVGISGLIWSEGEADFPVPIVLAQFTARTDDHGAVLIAWATASETNNFGFYLQRKRGGEEAFVDVSGAFVAGHGTTIQPHAYTVTDAPGATADVWYRLKQVDLDGSVRYSDPVRVEGVTAVASTVPVASFLAQNYPNPFNPSTTIRYGIAGPSQVTLRIFNALGQEVALLQDGVLDAGVHAVVFDARSLPSGMYWYTLQVRPLGGVAGGSFRATKQLLLVR